jgi:hypothetical protein
LARSGWSTSATDVAGIRPYRKDTYESKKRRAGRSALATADARGRGSGCDAGDGGCGSTRAVWGRPEVGVVAIRRPIPTPAVAVETLCWWLCVAQAQAQAVKAASPKHLTNLTKLELSYAIKR